MIEDIKHEASARMAKSVDNLQHELIKLRTGRARTSLLDHITVSYYGATTPLNQVASIAIGDARTLLVTPWENNMVVAVEKAILASDLGLTPATSGNVIRIPLPPLTEERRRDLVKLVRQEGEGGRVAIRNIRREANADLKELLKEKDITEDEERRAQEAIQKLTDKYIADVDKILATKEAELLEV